MKIEHQPARSRFVIDLPEGEAVLEYVLAPAGMMNMLSTEVPVAARGKGTGGVLVQAAMEYARAQGLQVIPSCWFVRTWVGEHPEYGGMLVSR